MAVADTESSKANINSSSSFRDRMRSKFAPFIFITPSAILVVLFFFIPVLLVLGISMTNMSTITGFRNWEWIGFGNYLKIFRSPDSAKIMWATIKYVVLTLILFNVGLALVLALLSTHVTKQAGIFFRALWLLPRLTPSVLYVMMWKYIAADAPYGILNQHILGPLGIPPTNLIPLHPWTFIVLVNGINGAAFGMIIFTSAIEAIPRDYMIAALVDGCSLWQRIRYVILPMLRWPLLFATTYETLSLLTSFVEIMLLTGGQFGTNVWALWAYQRALSNQYGNFQWGFGSALAGVLVIIGIIMSFVYMRYFQFNELVQEPKIEAL
jgi:inositol-phosphate transport system permease protein